jgi:type I restriction enzyme S subunit
LNRPFDEARYKGLLEGLEISVHRYLQLESDLRIDSEFFLKNVQQVRVITAKLKMKRLRDIADVADGDHAKFPDTPGGTIRYLQAQDFDGFVGPTGEAYVTKEYFLENQRSRIEANNVLFSIMGTVGQVGLTPQDFEPCMANRAVGIIRPNPGVSVAVIFAYLGSSIGRQSILGYSNGAVQKRINLDLLRSIEVPQFSELFEQALEKTIAFAFSEKN